jgi:methionyl-tRNA formyltransferase
LEQSIDTGAIIAEQRFPVRQTYTGLTLFARGLAAETALATDIIARIAMGEDLHGPKTSRADTFTGIGTLSTAV